MIIKYLLTWNVRIAMSQFDISRTDSVLGKCFKEMVETYINKLGEKSESPMGFDPMTFRKTGGLNYKSIGSNPAI